jgi:hypothetical protein
MEVGQGPNWGSSANGKKSTIYEATHYAVFSNILPLHLK